MSKIEINKEMVVSTYHVSLKCFEDIERHAGGANDDSRLNMLSIYIYKYGVRIFTSYMNSLQEGDIMSGYPELDILLKHARSLECKWLVLDQDSDDLDMFKTFDW